jgi:hypothetical protein
MSTVGGRGRKRRSIRRRIVRKVSRFYHANVCTAALIIALTAMLIVIQVVWG